MIKSNNVDKFIALLKYNNPFIKINKDNIIVNSIVIPIQDRPIKTTTKTILRIK